MAVGISVERADSKNILPAGIGFHDDALQFYILPYLYADGQSVDPYEGGEFSGFALPELLENLDDCVTYVKSLDDDQWPFTEAGAVEDYYRRGRASHHTLLAPRDQVLADLAGIRTAIELAIRHGATIFFWGD